MRSTKALGGRTPTYVPALLIVYHRPSNSFTHTALGLSAPEFRRKTLKYAIGPRRPDERVTVEALWIADPDLLDMEVHDEHDEGCCCRVLWDTVRERYGLDARALPDEMRPMRRQWTHGRIGTWLWWD